MQPVFVVGGHSIGWHWGRWRAQAGAPHSCTPPCCRRGAAHVGVPALGGSNPCSGDGSSGPLVPDIPTGWEDPGAWNLWPAGCRG